MKYFAVNLERTLDYHSSGKSVNKTAMKHCRRASCNYEIIIVTEGVLHMEQIDKFNVKSGQVFFIDKNVVHGGTKFSKNVFFWLHFDGEIKSFLDERKAKEFCESNKKWIFIPQLFSLKELARVSVMFGEINHYRFENSDTLVKNHLTSALIAELSRQYNERFLPYSEDKRFAEILGYLNLHIRETISISELAEKFSYNPKYLSSLFKKFTNQSPIEYITKLKLAVAKHLLLSGCNSIKAVAHELGYNDEYYFMKVFKRYTGITPKNYRKTFSACAYT